MKRRLQSLRSTLGIADLSVAAVPDALESGRSEEARRVYNSRRWRDRVRPAKLARDPLCQCCARKGIVTEATEVDHWLAISKGGDPWSDGNLVALCISCHSMKTRCEQTGEALPEIVASTPRELTFA